MKNAPFSFVLLGTTLLLTAPCYAAVAAGACDLSAVPHHASSDATRGADRPRIGLVLSGGGARGGAHVGVLKVLEAARVPIDYIAGTSVGAIIGALYATGNNADEIESFVAAIDWTRVFDDATPRSQLSFRRKTDDELALVEPGLGYSSGAFRFRSGLVLGQNIQQVLARVGSAFPGERNFDHLAVPFRAITTDIETGRAVVLGEGDLVTALRASMAVPGAFSPVEIDGRLLVDGGVADNLPIDVVRAMGADIVIAVDVGAPMLSRKDIQSAVDITEQLTTILTRRSAEEQKSTLNACDVLLVPQLERVGSTDFARIAELAPFGAQAAELQRARLESLSLDKPAYAALIAARPRAGSGVLPRIGFVRVDNRSTMADSTVRHLLRVEELLGQPLNPEQLTAHFAPLYGSRLFESVSYELMQANGQHGIKVLIREKSWGPNYLNLRFLAQGGLSANNGLSVGVDYLLTNVTANGGEWRNYLQLGAQRLIFSELFQPLQVDSAWFVMPRVVHRKESQGLFDADGDRIAEIDLSESHVEAGFGYEFNRDLRVHAGLRSGVVDTRARVGSLSPRADSEVIGEAFATISVDALDDRFFPSGGQRWQLGWLTAHRGLGADSEFDQVQFSWLGAKAVDHTHWLMRAEYQRTLRGLAPLHRRARLGGFFKLSGLESDQYTGQHAALVGAALYQRFEFPLLRSYVGLSVEYGNVFEDEDFGFRDGLFAGSVWAGADTLLGPLYVGYGVVEDGRDAIFLSLGRPF